MSSEEEQQQRRQRRQQRQWRWWRLGLFRGMANDIRRRAPYYWGDWKDAWDYRVVPATVYIYFAKYDPRILRGAEMETFSGFFFLFSLFREKGLKLSILNTRTGFRLGSQLVVCLRQYYLTPMAVYYQH